MDDQIAALVSAYRINGATDGYLARLAVAYAAMAPSSRSVSTDLAQAVGIPLPTMKGHIMRCRREGFLTKVKGGARGGVATPMAIEQLIGPSESELAVALEVLSRSKRYQVWDTDTSNWI